jgi:hypothetical protein
VNSSSSAVPSFRSSQSASDAVAFNLGSAAFVRRWHVQLFFPEDSAIDAEGRSPMGHCEILETSIGWIQSLDEQSDRLSRSTTWSILKGLHKNSGLSTTTILRVLSHKRLPAPVRTKLLEYVEEKARGLYGDSPRRVEQFKERWARLPASQSQTVHL